uniref:Uncharacterized protein n=1 Tax=Globodera rostochiensis TaxID=31243 RepID=A0A914I1T2_GLORO
MFSSTLNILFFIPALSLQFVLLPVTGYSPRRNSTNIQSPSNNSHHFHHTTTTTTRTTIPIGGHWGQEKAEMPNLDRLSRICPQLLPISNTTMSLLITTIVIRIRAFLRPNLALIKNRWKGFQIGQRHSLIVWVAQESAEIAKSHRFNTTAEYQEKQSNNRTTIPTMRSTNFNTPKMIRMRDGTVFHLLQAQNTNDIDGPNNRSFCVFLFSRNSFVSSPPIEAQISPSENGTKTSAVRSPGGVQFISKMPKGTVFGYANALGYR